MPRLRGGASSAQHLPKTSAVLADLSKNVGAALPGERRRRSAPDFDDAVDWVVRYLRDLESRERPSARRYNRWAKRHDGAPWASEFGRHHDGWLTVLDAARAKLRKP